MDQENARHRFETQRLAFFAGTTLGVAIAALGTRVLEMFIDPAPFAVLPEAHQRLFH